ncbi:cytochrome P450 [Obba rivulosa]|uniref:Cytochrome P450 n=1 Tax=Obba rivulosa TaxID=1052685 RepID=A0A8E2B1M8_9APHY|nr:cytochrome P450 [Obba rivulosa]
MKSVLLASAPPVFVLVSAHLLQRLAGIVLPTWLLVIAAVCSTPFMSAFRIWARHWKISREAKRMGAKLLPNWEGKSIGNFDILQTLMQDFRAGYVAEHFAKTTDVLGPTYLMELLWDPTVVTSDPAVIKTVLATDFPNYVKGDFFRSYMYSVLGTGVFNADGDMWKFHRTMTRPFFTRERIGHFEMFDRHTNKALQMIKERFRAGHPLDFQDLVSRFTLDSATEFLFGTCVNSLDSALPYPHNASSPAKASTSTTASAEAFAAAFNSAQHVISERGRTGWIWPLFEIFKDKSAEHMRVVDNFLEPVLKEALTKKERRIREETKEKDETEDETLLDHLVKFTSDPVVLHDETLNILIAGRDTTASTLTFAVYLLTQHPEVLRRLRQEVLSKVGPTRMPTYEDIRELKYLRAVLNETLRLYPPVPVNVRYTVDATTLPNTDPLGKPYYVPANTAVAYSVFVMHRRPEYWGPDAEQFDPDRFLDERVNKYLTANPFIFLPFNAGPRICLGQQFAYNESSFFLIKLLQHFSEMSLDTEAQPADSRPPADWAKDSGRKGMEQLIPRVHLTMYSKGGMWMRMQEATYDETDDA